KASADGPRSPIPNGPGSDVGWRRRPAARTSRVTPRAMSEAIVRVRRVWIPTMTPEEEMRPKTCLFAALLSLPLTCPAQLPAIPPPSPAQEASPARSPVPRDESLPPSEDQARAALEKSPRHGELVDIKLPSGVTMRTWIAYPERKDRAGVVILIHEIFGLSDW